MYQKSLRIPCLAAVRIQRLSMIVYKCLQTAPDCLWRDSMSTVLVQLRTLRGVILAGLRRVPLTDSGRPEGSALAGAGSNGIMSVAYETAAYFCDECVTSVNAVHISGTAGEKCHDFAQPRTQTC